MSRKQDETHKRKAGSPAASSGQGAASALDALIKRRVIAPGQDAVKREPKSKKN